MSNEVNMDFKRFIKHLFTTESAVKRHFSDASLSNITSAVADAERQHRGEICFAIEAALEPGQVLRGITPRQRAMEIFAQQRVWDTELNSGVLIYVLFADRAVEVIADRGIYDKTAQNHCWENIVKAMENAFSAGRFEDGAVDGIKAVATELINYFPASDHNPDELPNNVVLV
ncbi:MAG: TPM domain-containing protein [Cellvibrio sp.]